MKSRSKKVILLIILVFISILYLIFSTNLSDYFNLKENKLLLRNPPNKVNVLWVGSLLNKNYQGKIPFDTILLYNNNFEVNKIPNSYGESKILVEFLDSVFVLPVEFKRKPWIKNKYILNFSKKDVELIVSKRSFIELSE